MSPNNTNGDNANDDNGKKEDKIQTTVGQPPQKTRNSEWKENKNNSDWKEDYFWKMEWVLLLFAYAQCLLGSGNVSLCLACFSMLLYFHPDGGIQTQPFGMLGVFWNLLAAKWGFQQQQQTQQLHSNDNNNHVMEIIHYMTGEERRWPGTMLFPHWTHLIFAILFAMAQWLASPPNRRTGPERYCSLSLEEYNHDDNNTNRNNYHFISSPSASPQAASSSPSPTSIFQTNTDSSSPSLTKPKTE